MPAYWGCPGKEAVKWVSVWNLCRLMLILCSLPYRHWNCIKCHVHGICLCLVLFLTNEYFLAKIYYTEKCSSVRIDLSHTVICNKCHTEYNHTLLLNPQVWTAKEMLLFFCLSAHVCQKSRVQISWNFLHMLPVAVVWSSSDDSAICYVFPLLWMTSGEVTSQ